MLHVSSDQVTAPAEASRPRRRWGWVLMGFLLAVLGLMLTITGAIVGFVSDTAAGIDPDGEARTPESIEFEAGDRNYEVLLVAERRTAAVSLAAATRCEIELANEREVTIDGSRQGVSSTNGNMASIGNFDAVDGRTTITCDTGGRNGVRYVVDDTSRLEAAAVWLLIAGSMVIGVGVALSMAGIFWKKPAGA